MNNKAVIQTNDVQRMSAGTGLTHSEYNLAEKPVHFYQIWIYPNVAKLTPSYDQKTYSPENWKNAIFPVASGQNISDAVTIHTNATIYRAGIDKSKSLTFETTIKRRIFVYITSGKIKINSETIHQHDQARIDSNIPLQIDGIEDAEFILIDVPA